MEKETDAEDRENKDREAEKESKAAALGLKNPGAAAFLPIILPENKKMNFSKEILATKNATS